MPQCPVFAGLSLLSPNYPCGVNRNFDRPSRYPAGGGDRGPRPGL